MGMTVIWMNRKNYDIWRSSDAGVGFVRGWMLESTGMFDLNCIYVVFNWSTKLFVA